MYLCKKKGGGIILKFEPLEKFIFQQLVMNFAIFGRIIRVLVQNSPTLTKYQPREKFILRQLVVILAYFRINNSLFMQNKIAHLKNISCEKSLYFNN